MPRWTFELPEGILSSSDKQSLVSQIIELYSGRGIPAPMIHVFLNEHKTGNYYNGLKTPASAVFFIISHAAREFASEDESARFHKAVKAIVDPIFGKRGFKWEYNVYQNSAEHWRINGQSPPYGQAGLWEDWVQEISAL